LQLLLIPYLLLQRNIQNLSERPVIKKILVANRSEIAIRVFRAANELSIRTVAVWAEEDKPALHRFKAGQARRSDRRQGFACRIRRNGVNCFRNM
jgi:hypothetical protein